MYARSFGLTGLSRPLSAPLRFAFTLSARIRFRPGRVKAVFTLALATSQALRLYVRYIPPLPHPERTVSGLLFSPRFLEKYLEYIKAVLE